MRRTLLKIAIFVLTFGFGVGVSVCWQLYQWSLVPHEVSPTCCDAAPVVGMPRITAPSQITIVGGMDACGPTANYHSLELSDGTRIFQSCERFSSPSAAARSLKTKLADAVIAGRLEERDENGRVIGKKILTTSPRVMRLSIIGNTLCVTDAPSLNHLQLYESAALYRSPINSGNE